MFISELYWILCAWFTFCIVFTMLFIAGPSIAARVRSMTRAELIENVVLICLVLCVPVVMVIGIFAWLIGG